MAVALVQMGNSVLGIHVCGPLLLYVSLGDAVVVVKSGRGLEG